MPRGRPATKKTTKRKSTKRTRKNDRIISVDFEGVETGGANLVPEGEYAATILSGEQYTAQSGNEAVKWVIEVTDGKYKGKKIYHNTSLQTQALWNLRGMLDACGFETPDSQYDIDLDEIEGAEVGIGVSVTEYEGRDQSRVSDFFPLDELNTSSDDAEENEEEGEGEEITPDDIRTYKLADLEEMVEEYGLEVDLQSEKTLARRRKLVIDAMTEEGYFEEE